LLFVDSLLAAAAHRSARMAAGGYHGYASALRRAMEREEARRDGDYSKADAIRSDLQADGVRVDDATHCFTTANGYRGSYSLQVGIGFHEIQLMCLDREEARRENRYQDADDIRQQLQACGASLDDRAHVFSMPDGARGSYDLYKVGGAPPSAPISHASSRPSPQPLPAAFMGAATNGMPPAARKAADMAAKAAQERASHEQAAREAAMRETEAKRTFDREMARWNAQQKQQPRQKQQQQSLHSKPPPEKVPLGSSAETTGSKNEIRFHGYLEALRGALDREQMRKSRNYQGADTMRTRLRSLGVEIDDASHTFCIGGLTGSYDLNLGISGQELQFVALEREEARRSQDYMRSDALRQWLIQQGVTLDDRTHTFSTSDGISGSYDLYKWTPVAGADASPSIRDFDAVGDLDDEPDEKRLRME